MNLRRLEMSAVVPYFALAVCLFLWFLLYIKAEILTQKSSLKAKFTHFNENLKWQINAI